jgi:putative Holliday junction resolvase
MLIRNIKEFLKKTLQKKIICLDIGRKKIGVAISDPNHKISMPLDILNKNKSFFSNIKKILIDFDVGGILIGLPLNEDKTFNKMCYFIHDFVKELDSYLLKNKLELPIFFWDESYTSFEASELTGKFFKNTKTQKKFIDKFAAKIILDDFFKEL